MMLYISRKDSAMPATDPRIDTYINAARPFARPILEYLRETVHRVCPEATETMKWSFPHFMYSGEILCSLAAFKEHVAFGFWKAAAMQDAERLLNPIGETAMGHFGKIRSLEDLPPPVVLERYIREAMRLNENGTKVRPTKSGLPKSQPEPPEDFLESLRHEPDAESFFRKLRPAQQAEYVNWILEARTTATRNKRLTTAVTWLTEGKRRNWKYER